MSREFLKVKNFNLKAKAYEFEDVQFMTASEKTKIYKAFVSFLNNHFKESNFKKNLYEHLHLHCGFIAHYNIRGFYSEYFTTPAKFQKLAFDYSSNPSEYGCYVNETYQGKDSLSAKQAFYKIYEELNSSRTGLGEFYSAIVDNGRYAYSGDYCDLNRAIAESFSEYIQTWRELIKSAIQDEHKQQKAKALKKVKQVPVIYTNRSNAQDILDLLNDKLWYSDTSFTHDSDKERVFIEVGDDVESKEFNGAYKKLKKLFGIEEFSSSYIVVDY